MHGKSLERRFQSSMWSNNQQTDLQNMELSVKNLVKDIQTKLKVIDNANRRSKASNETV